MNKDLSKYIVVITLCIIAAFRVWIFCAAFPFFCNVDEQAHFDTVIKYARGYLPHKGGTEFDKESIESILLYSTAEYIEKPEDFPRGIVPPPLCALPKEQVRTILKETTKKSFARYNTEAFSPPVYYLIAGAWYNVGKLLGKHGIRLLYWIRFLNAGIIFFIVWFSYLFCKRLFPDTKFMYIGLPFIVAFLPQDAFYAITNDVLSPLFFTISLYLLLQWYQSDTNKYQSSFVTGAFVATTFLTKFSNIAIIGVASIICLLKIIRPQGTERFKERWHASAFVMITALLPIGLWAIRNRVMLGDFSGSMDKVIALGWMVKPLSTIWNHPIFTPKGMILFWDDLIRSFWRGEFTWHLSRLSLNASDLFYSLSSFVFLFTASIKLLFSKKTASKSNRFVGIICIIALLFSIICLIGLSITFDFGHCWYPSREYPYCTSGRLIIGAIVPFFVLYLNGMSVVMKKLKMMFTPIIAIAIIVFCMTWSEITITQPVFSNPYNWFHLKE